nr:7455_t:CDS:2 [Entrophospora candida]
MLLLMKLNDEQPSITTTSKPVPNLPAPEFDPLSDDFNFSRDDPFIASLTYRSLYYLANGTDYILEYSRKVRKRIDDTALSYIGFRPNYIPQNYIESQMRAGSISPWGFAHNGCGISKRLKEKTVDKLERKTDELKKNNNHISITIADTNEQEDSLEEKSNHSNDQENYLKRLEDLEAFRILLEKNFIDTSLINSIKKEQKEVAK